MKLRLPNLGLRGRRWLRLGAYPCFYFFCLVLFARLTFPYDRVKNRILAEFHAQQTGPNAKQLEIDDVSGYWLFGVEAEGVRLITPPAPEKAGDDPGEVKPKARVLSVDALHASVSLFRLMFGTTAVDFGLEIGEGVLEGNFVRSSDMSELALDITDLSVAGLAPLEEIIQLPLEGTLAGHAEFHMPEGKLEESEGKLDLSIDALQVGDGKAKIRDTIALPKLRVGTLTLTAEAVQGKLDLKELSANGPDFQLKSDGSVRLRDPFNSSVADLRVNFKFKDAYKNKNDITRGLFGAPDSNVPGLFDLDPKIKRAKGADGFYGWRAAGQVAKMSFTPASESGGAAATPRTPRTRRTKPSVRPKKSSKPKD
jgi:type II secretion system protein N